VYSQLVCPVVKILGLKDKWISINYSGSERVNFARMKWVYLDSQANPDEEERDIKRVDGRWMITDEHQRWIKFEQYDGENDLLDEQYQMWIKGE